LARARRFLIAHLPQFLLARRLLARVLLPEIGLFPGAGLDEFCRSEALLAIVIFWQPPSGENAGPAVSF
jgi:hypothetical protein